jgi:hypothetical protein
MKTQIIQLESHDDIISIRDKMGWSQTSRILLVWPEKKTQPALDLVKLLAIAVSRFSISACQQ